VQRTGRPASLGLGTGYSGLAAEGTSVHGSQDGFPFVPCRSCPDWLLGPQPLLLPGQGGITEPLARAHAEWRQSASPRGGAVEVLAQVRPGPRDPEVAGQTDRQTASD
jgi:hypothetical protein